MSSPCRENQCGPCPVGYIFEEFGQARGEAVADAVQAGVEQIPPEARNAGEWVHAVVRVALNAQKRKTFQGDVEEETASLGVVLALQGSCDKRPEFSRD